MRKITSTAFSSYIKNLPVIFLKIIILLIVIVALIWLVWFPQLEGRAVHLDLIGIYSDPLILFGYIASIPFFVGLFQAFKLLDLIDKNKAFSQGAVDTLRIIKLSALLLIGFIVLGELILFFLVKGEEITGPAALGIYFACSVVVIYAIADIFQKLLIKGNFKK